MNKRFWLVVPAALVVVFLALGAASTGINKQFEAGTGPKVRIGGSLTYSNSQSSDTTWPKVRKVDTLTYNRPAGLAGAAFSAYWADSVKIVSVIMRRVYDGVEAAVQVGDTTVAAFAGTSTSHKFATITLAPLADAYRFYVTYDTTANGYTSGTVNYVIEQQFYDR